MKQTLVIVAVVLLACGQVLSAPIATPMSAIFIFAACKESKTNDYARGFCNGAIEALYGSIQDWCVPANVPHGEVKAYVIGDLLKSIPSPSVSAFEFVSRSVHGRWPCE